MLRRSLRRLALLSLALTPLTLAACGSSSDAPGGPAAGAYPAAKDADEGTAGNGTPATATDLPVGTSRNVTIFPQGDKDYYAVQLTAGVNYEFSANHLSVNSDLYLHLYDTDGTTQLALNDDYINLDSRFLYTPTVTGKYYVMARAWDATFGIAAYTVSVHAFVDADGDRSSTRYDCNDASTANYPGWDHEVPGDGIDQDCNGSDDLVGTTADAAEPDDTPAQARDLILAGTDPEEIQFTGAFYGPSRRTLDDAADVDWFRVSVPAHGRYEVNQIQITGTQAQCTLYDSDTATALPSGCAWLTNEGAAAKTFYLKFGVSAGALSGFYVPVAVDYGVDLDGDGAYTRDWDSDRDCNDAAPTIGPGQPDTAGDGIDQDCDGIDG